MSLHEVARFTDVYEADLAAAFLASHDIEVSVTERFQTTVDPSMQRALGIRLMAPASQLQHARDLLARAQAGEFTTPDGEDLDDAGPGTRVAGTAIAVSALLTGAFWGTSLPRRFRPLEWRGMLLSATLLAVGLLAAKTVAMLLLDPP